MENRNSEELRVRAPRIGAFLFYTSRRDRMLVHHRSFSVAATVVTFYVSLDSLLLQKFYSLDACVLSSKWSKDEE
jgi:hypothetical protein